MAFFKIELAARYKSVFVQCCSLSHYHQFDIMPIESNLSIASDMVINWFDNALPNCQKLEIKSSDNHTFSLLNFHTNNCIPNHVATKYLSTQCYLYIIMTPPTEIVYKCLIKRNMIPLEYQVIKICDQLLNMESAYTNLLKIFVDTDNMEPLIQFIKNNLHFIYHNDEEISFKLNKYYFNATYSDQGISAAACNTNYLAQIKYIEADKMIGQGSFGKVYLVHNTQNGKQYAMKVIEKERVSGSYGDMRRVMTEKDVLSQNSNTPFLAHLHYSFQTSKKLFLIMNFIGGGELYFHVLSKFKISEHDARFYGAEISAAIGYLHSNCIIYRDLKLENIMLDKHGHIVLTDFGMCKQNTTATGITHTFCGTRQYLAPEVVSRLQYTFSADWWSFGIVLFEMLYGSQPFENEYQIVNRKLRMLNTISGPARNILKKLLSKSKDKRLGSVGDFNSVKIHPFFDYINWEDVFSRNLKPPFQPSTNMLYVDGDCLNQPVEDSIKLPFKGGIKSQSQDLKDKYFPGFAYVHERHRHE